METFGLHRNSVSEVRRIADNRRLVSRKRCNLVAVTVHHKREPVARVLGVCCRKKRAGNKCDGSLRICRRAQRRCEMPALLRCPRRRCRWRSRRCRSSSSRERLRTINRKFCAAAKGRGPVAYRRAGMRKQVTDHAGGAVEADELCLPGWKRPASLATCRISIAIDCNCWYQG